MPGDYSLKDCFQAGTNDHFRNDKNNKTLNQHCVKDKVFHKGYLLFLFVLHLPRGSSNIFERIRPLFLRAYESPAVIPFPAFLILSPLFMIDCFF